MAAEAWSRGLVIVLLGGCGPAPRPAAPAGGHSIESTQPPDARNGDGWRSLLEADGASQWRGYRAQQLPAEWKVQEGTLSKETSAPDIVTRETFADFELTLEWRLAPGGNSGLFYRGTEDHEYIYCSAPEYQLLDDARASDGKSRMTSAGAVHSVYAAPAGIVKPADQWNSAHIVAHGSHVEHWMNGQMLVEYELWTPAWKANVQASKFAHRCPQYGLAKTGHIAIQGDHEGKLDIRNVRIRTFP